MYKEYPESFNAQENKFEIAIGFLQIRPYKYKVHDPRIGQINIRMVEMDQSSGETIIFNKFPMQHHLCNKDDDFLKDSEQESAFKQNIDKFICLDMN